MAGARTGGGLADGDGECGDAGHVGRNGEAHQLPSLHQVALAIRQRLRAAQRQNKRSNINSESIFSGMVPGASLSVSDTGVASTATLRSYFLHIADHGGKIHGAEAGSGARAAVPAAAAAPAAGTVQRGYHLKSTCRRVLCESGMES